MITSLLPFFNIKKFTSYHENHLDNATKICYTCDNKGNILTKSVSGANPREIAYSYREGTDRLMSFDGETFVYDNLGNPTTYRGKAATWVRGRCLESFNGNTYTYDAGGIRTSKTSGGITTNYIYDNGKLLRQTTNTESIDFIYGGDGMIGFKVNGGVNAGSYLYRKNLFGDITQIYTANGELVGKYSYTAFGECAITQDTNGIATLNPIRYRSYYYDTETGLFYCTSRYYDPEVGRFINADDISYLDPESINGLNLYAYCGNNPVMMVDPSGCVPWWNWLISGLQIVVGGILVATGVGAGMGAMLVAGGVIGMVSNALGSTIGGGIGSMVNGVGAISTGISLLSFGIPGIIAGIGLMAVGGATMAMGANEVVAGITGTNNMRDWMGGSLYDGLYLGLNIASAVGSVVGRLGMRTVGTKMIGSHDPLSRSGQKPYSSITRGKTITNFNGRGVASWSRHNALHGGRIGNPHWHSEIGGHGLERSWIGMLLEVILKGILRR